MHLLQERLMNLQDIRVYLEDEKRFALSQRDWDRVKKFTRLLRKHAEQVAMVRHQLGLIKRAA